MLKRGDLLIGTEQPESPFLGVIPSRFYHCITGIRGAMRLARDLIGDFLSAIWSIAQVEEFHV